MSGSAKLTVTSAVAKQARAQAHDARVVGGQVRGRGQQVGDAQAVGGDASGRSARRRAPSRPSSASRWPASGLADGHAHAGLNRKVTPESMRAVRGRSEAGGRFALTARGGYPALVANAFREENSGTARRRNHHEWGHRPDGDEPTSHPLDPGHPRAGRPADRGRGRHLAGAVAGRAQRGQARGAGRRTRAGAVVHGPRRGPRGPAVRDLLRRAAHVRAAGRGGEGDRGGQAHLLREAGHAGRRDGAGARAARRATRA